MSEIDEEFLTRSEAQTQPEKKHRKIAAIGGLFVAAAALAVILLNNQNLSKGETANKYTVASPQIAKQIQFTADYNSAQYEDYHAQKRNRIIDNQTQFDFSHFFSETGKAILAEDDGKNKIYSPVNLYIALSMLASSCDGETQKEILSLLDAPSENEAHTVTEKLLRRNYIDDGSQISLPKNSLWIGNKYSLKEDFLKTLSDRYYAPVFQGNAADPKYSKAFQAWLNDATGGFLKNSVQQFEFDPEMALTLSSTLYFAANWDTEFSPEETSEMIFHGVSKDTACDFMKQTYFGNYYSNENFSAVKKMIANGGNMIFILPSENKTCETLFSENALSDFLLNGNIENQSYPEIHLSLPKFDISSDLNLRKNLSSCNIRSVFDPASSDFSPISETPLFLSEIQHSARVAIDEKGITAAAFTIEELCGAALPMDEVDFRLDRPFIFAIESDSGDILFIGVVNTV